MIIQIGKRENEKKCLKLHFLSPALSYLCWKGLLALFSLC
ncbi:hypothetical protein ApDm4_1928 [Acetobacter pomorum]|nr:hypothetical protein ApDm4_1928 [Acetobacter pomorum]